MADRVYVVKPRQYLIGICHEMLGEAYGGVYQAVARYNHMVNPDLIFPGQKIYFPANKTELFERLRKGQLAPTEEGKAVEQAPAVIERAMAPVKGSPKLVLNLGAGGRITSGYGPRGDHFHSGVDYIGTKLIYAGVSGVVTHASDVNNGYGTYVIIDGRPGPVTLDGHMEPNLLVAVGDEVKQGDPIGTMGNTGLSFGVHGHREYQADVEEDGWTWGGSSDPSDIMQVVRE